MKTIKEANISNFKSTQKMLVSRSRSGAQGVFPSRQSQSRVSVSPYRNSIGLKSYQEESNIKKLTLSASSFNQDYYDSRVTQQFCKISLPKFSDVAANKIQAQKLPEKQQMKEAVSWGSEQNTAQTSKISNFHENKLTIAGCEYFLSDYISPSFKIKKLEKEKQIQKKKSQENLMKILKDQEAIQKNRNRYKRQTQLYEKIMHNLNRKKKPSELSISLHQKLTSCLKNSGSIDTEAGESSNQI